MVSWHVKNIHFYTIVYFYSAEYFSGQLYIQLHSWRLHLSNNITFGAFFNNSVVKLKI